MKSKIAFAAFSVTLLLAPGAFAGGMYQPDGVQPIDPHGGPPQRMQLPPDPEGRAVELRLAGKCQQAIPILRVLAENERDDIAKFNLGQCLLDISTTTVDPQRVSREGASWMLKAANDGLPNAQSSLIGIYLDGAGVPRDPVEAGKWSLLYHSNGTRLALGMRDISPDLQARLDSTLTGTNWTQARERADEWSPSSINAEE